MSRIPKGFIPLGEPGCWLSARMVDQGRSRYDARTGKVAVIDRLGNRFDVEPRLLAGRMRWGG